MCRPPKQRQLPREVAGCLISRENIHRRIREMVPSDLKHDMGRAAEAGQSKSLAVFQSCQF